MTHHIHFRLNTNSSRRTWVVLGLLALALMLTPTHAARAAPKAIITVTNTNDSGGGSLRWAVGVPNPSGGDTINFFLFGCPCTITLTSGEIVIDKDVAITGLGQSMLSISGNNASRVFNITTTDPVSISDVTIKNGRTTDGGTSASGGAGGGIFTASNALTIINSTFYSNATGNGGSCAGSFCSAGYGGNGGGIFQYGGALTIINSNFSSNTTGNGGSCSGITCSARNGGGGGGIIQNGGTLTIINSTFSSNATGTGGSCDGGGCLAGFGGRGGGIEQNGGTTTITNTTLSNNSAHNSGGGVANVAGTMTLYNTIVANSPSGGNCFGAITNGGGNLSYPDATCPGINSDPKLAPLANYGGATKTMGLLLGSAAIDAAVDANCPSTDQRGVARPIGAHCDIGAYEAPIYYLFPLIFR